MTIRYMFAEPTTQLLPSTIYLTWLNIPIFTWRLLGFVLYHYDDGDYANDDGDGDDAYQLERESRQQEGRLCWKCSQHLPHSRCIGAFIIVIMIMMKMTMIMMTTIMMITYPSTFLYSAKWLTRHLPHHPYNTSLRCFWLSFCGRVPNTSWMKIIISTNCKPGFLWFLSGSAAAKCRDPVNHQLMMMMVVIMTVFHNNDDVDYCDDDDYLRQKRHFPQPFLAQRTLR